MSRQVPAQLVSPVAHVTTHVLPEHTVPAAHARPHAPQFALSVVRSRHVPEQFVRPAPQVV
jgi:hypothetical protein